MGGGPTWHLEVIDNNIGSGSSISGRHASIGIGSNGRVRVAYYRYGNLSGGFGGDVRWSERNALGMGGSWSSPVTIATAAGEHLAMALTSTNLMRIAVRDRGNGDLDYIAESSYGVFPPPTPIATSGSVGGVPAITVDGSDLAHILHRSYDSNTVVYLRETSPGTFASSVDLSSGDYPAIIRSGQTTIALLTTSSGLIAREAPDGMGFGSAVTIASTSGNYGTGAARSGNVAAGYNASSIATIAQRESGWQPAESPSTTSGGATYVSMAWGIAGDLHVVFYYNSGSSLRYTVRSVSGVWSPAVDVDSAGSVGIQCAVAVDINGGVHIVYEDVSNGDLKYAGLW